MTAQLPNDLIARGFKLIERDGRYIATSISFGCTGTKPTVKQAIAEARSIARFIDWYEQKQQEIRAASIEHDEAEQPAP